VANANIYSRVFKGFNIRRLALLSGGMARTYACDECPRMSLRCQVLLVDRQFSFATQNLTRSASALPPDSPVFAAHSCRWACARAWPPSWSGQVLGISIYLDMVTNNASLIASARLVMSSIRNCCSPSGAATATAGDGRRAGFRQFRRVSRQFRRVFRQFRRPSGIICVPAVCKSRNTYYVFRDAFTGCIHGTRRGRGARCIPRRLAERPRRPMHPVLNIRTPKPPFWPISISILNN
jgi:hypothetical protein